MNWSKIKTVILDFFKKIWTSIWRTLRHCFCTHVDRHEIGTRNVYTVEQQSWKCEGCEKEFTVRVRQTKESEI